MVEEKQYNHIIFSPPHPPRSHLPPCELLRREGCTPGTDSPATKPPPTIPATKFPSANLPTQPVLFQNNKIGVVTATGNYILSFEILPRATVSGWGNIIHFTSSTTSDCCYDPCIWFKPGTTALAVYVNSVNTITETSYELPLNVRTKVTLELNGLDMKLTVGASVYSSKQTYRRYAGNQSVYVSDPWWQAANAEIYNLDYKILPAGLNAGKAYIILYNLLSLHTQVHRD